MSSTGGVEPSSWSSCAFAAAVPLLLFLAGASTQSTRMDADAKALVEKIDAVAPKHPVLYHAGPAGVANSKALEVSGVTTDTKVPNSTNPSIIGMSRPTTDL